MLKLVPTKKGFSFNVAEQDFNKSLFYGGILTDQKYFFSHFPKGLKTMDRNMIIREQFEREVLFEPYTSNSFQYKTLKEIPLIQKLISEKILDSSSVESLESIYKKRRNRAKIDSTTIEEFMLTEQFLKARKVVESLFGNRIFEDNTQLFDYQLDCAALIVSRKRLLEALDTGMGKTRTTIVGLASNPANKKILIVTMSRNLSDWQRELKILGLENDYIILENPEHMKSTKRFHLVSYEKWALDNLKFKESKRVSFFCEDCNKPMHKNFCSCGWTEVVKRKKALYKYFNRSYDAAAIDEGHLIKNGTTSRTKAIMAIKTKTRVLLSGTPAENGASDLFWLLGWLIGDKINFFDFEDTSIFNAYGGRGQKRFREVYGGVNARTVMDSDRINARVANHEKLWRLLDTVMFRKLKTDEDVSGDLQVPEPIHRRIHLDMNDEEKHVYNIRLREFNAWFNDMMERRQYATQHGLPIPNEMINICSWLDKLRRVASAPWLEPEYEGTMQPSKLEFVRAKVQEAAFQNKKLLIFTAHKKTAEELGLLLDQFVPGFEAGYIHGSVPMFQRKYLMDRFQNPDDGMSILIMTMRTGAESYTLTQAKKVIFMDLDYNAKKIEQCYSRAVRLGQKEVVEVSWLISVDTIDANMHSLILSKKTGVDLAIDRKNLDFAEFAKEFEGNIANSTSVDFEEFAKEMLSRGTKRHDYEHLA